MENNISYIRTRALIKKEFFQIIRDPSCILVSVVLPLILLFIYGFGVSLDLNHLRIGLVLQDTGPDAQSFTESFIASPYFDVRIGRDIREFEQDLVRGSIRGIVVVPSYFSEFRRIYNKVAPIQVIGDGSEPNTANFVQNYVRSAFQNWQQIESMSEKPQNLSFGLTPYGQLQAVSSGSSPQLSFVQLVPRYWFNEELESRNFLVPGSLALIMALVGTLLTALVVAREWERGTMEALISTPVRIVEILIGKFIPYFILGLFTMTMCVIIAIFLYQLPFRGSILALFLLTSAFLIAALGLGLLISTIAKNQFVAGQFSMLSAFLPAFMLSGFIFEISSMPFPIQCLTYLLAPRYFVSALQTIFLVGNVWQLFIIDIIPMLLLGLAFFVINSRKIVKRLD
jgi:ABC-2 type transport system permease protein